MDLSISEWIVYGLFCYGSVFMMVISVVKEIPSSRSLSFTRIIGLMPGLICAGILAMSGVHIDLYTDSTASTTNVYNGTHHLIQNSTETISKTSQIVLQSNVWLMVHMMFFLILLIFIIYQILTLMTRTD